MSLCSASPFLFFFNDTATTEIYTLSLHDALPILQWQIGALKTVLLAACGAPDADGRRLCGRYAVAWTSGLAKHPRDGTRTRLHSRHDPRPCPCLSLKSTALCDRRSAAPRLPAVSC